MTPPALYRTIAGARRPLGIVSALVCAVTLASSLAACSPKLDWRTVHPADAGIGAMFPCKPAVNSRPATAAEPAAMGLAECKADQWTFSLAWADLADPALVGPALSQMPRSLAGKLNAQPGAVEPLAVPGMTPNPAAQMQRLSGDKQKARVAVFARGLRVYQVLMLGVQDNPAAWDSFLTSLKLDS
ncbi:hypothetical protein [Roseateles oligotrophus]|uniref:Transmembrane protein n=1 Tax=Roseateles oligotrophus TaxID=1769250 RepID=A0ABT2YDX9_9BURK|nr:hypothetical protein [Roseateles oligotrophus]MCV2368237.1 hypothetical protein [Roseateles oligotrophus]